MGLLSAARAANQAKKLRELKAVNTARETLNAAAKMTPATPEGRQMVGAAKRAVAKGVDPYNSMRDFAKGGGIPPFTPKPLVGLSDSDKMYLLGKSKGMDPYNTASSYTKAGKMVGSMSAKPVSGSPGLGPRKPAAVIYDHSNGQDPYNTLHTGDGYIHPIISQASPKAKKKKK